MIKIEDARGLAAPWVNSPTIEDLIRESNRLSIEPRGLPSRMQIYEVAELLLEMKLPLRALQEGEKWANGNIDENVCTTDGQIFCKFVRRGDSRSYLDFTEHARKIIQEYATREQSAGLKALSAPKTA
jgi:hypothetical protein